MMNILDPEISIMRILRGIMEEGKKKNQTI
jgi:hypothetical protein